MTSLSEFVVRRRVAFHEVDSAGIVHFSVYFRYMEEAEHGLWRAAGLSIAPRGSAVGFPRVSAGFDYHRPLRFEDQVDIRIRIVSISEKSVRYRCTLSREGERVATGTLVVVCVAKQDDGSMQARPIPPEIARCLAVSTETGD